MVHVANKVKLDLAIADYPHTAALLSGEVKIEGVEANFIRVNPQIARDREYPGRGAIAVWVELRRLAPNRDHCLLRQLLGSSVAFARPAQEGLDPGREVLKQPRERVAIAPCGHRPDQRRPMCRIGLWAAR